MSNPNTAPASRSSWDAVLEKYRELDERLKKLEAKYK